MLLLFLTRQYRYQLRYAFHMFVFGFCFFLFHFFSHKLEYKPTFFKLYLLLHFRFENLLFTGSFTSAVLLWFVFFTGICTPVCSCTFSSALVSSLTHLPLPSIQESYFGCFVRFLESRVCICQGEPALSHPERALAIRPNKQFPQWGFPL